MKETEVCWLVDNVSERMNINQIVMKKYMKWNRCGV